jgi:hypothetical protein
MSNIDDISPYDLEIVLPYEQDRIMEKYDVF